MTISYFWLNEPMNTEKITGAFLIILANMIGIMRNFKRGNIPMDID
jgi:hypothetical protein